ncbi:phosphoribosyltransferase-like protein [Acinetobacter calcoaceticus]|uniref:phosphoribosyltransferase-like protein n=1 Tax=Acinetobacter calcoaceticus TaxID=471 RepID=UPI000696F2A4|nr:hypothetical protein [Acinetobacter calcoaceticus]
MNNQDYQNLSIEKIYRSKDIQEWLSQFDEDEKELALLMLSKLKFVSRDTYASWLQTEIVKLIPNIKYALYSVRKLEEDENKKFLPYWNDLGDISKRPASSQGSEDFIYSLISSYRKAHNNLFEHCSLDELRENKIKNLVLIDDAIGSGERVYSFINSMLNNKTFKSWWSLGLINFHVYSFTRNTNAQSNIIKNVIGSDHSTRKHRKSKKIYFYSKYNYSHNLEVRWGDRVTDIIKLCESKTKIYKKGRKGHGDVMSNIVFYHSIPNNIPGMFWYSSDNWTPIFPNRTLPQWVQDLIENKVVEKSQITPKQVIDILELIQKGYISKTSLIMKLDIDISLLNYFLEKCITLNFLYQDTLRLTTIGRDFLHKNQKTIPKWNQDLYIPSSWCSD